MAARQKVLGRVRNSVCVVSPDPPDPLSFLKKLDKKENFNGSSLINKNMYIHVEPYSMCNHAIDLCSHTQLLYVIYN